MLRRWLLQNRAGDVALRWRTTDVSRLESFSDAVFGFALTILVISQQMPRTIDDVLHLLSGIPAFAITFLFLANLWWQHCQFFRRFGLQDRTTVLVNSAFLFVVIVYVYPLRFIFSLAFDGIFGLHTLPPFAMTVAQARVVIAFYMAGFMAVYLLLALLYLHAHRQRDTLELTPTEVALTVEIAQRHLIIAGCGLVVIVLAVVLPGQRCFDAMWALFGMWPVLAWHGRRARLRRPAA